MALAVANVPTKGTLTWIVNLPVDIVRTRIMIDHRDLVCLRSAATRLEILCGQSVVPLMRVLFADDLELRDFSLEVRIGNDSILLTGMMHGAKNLMAYRVEVNTAACAGSIVRLCEHVA